MRNPRVSAVRMAQCRRRCFHDYFVTHLPSTSMHPDSRSSSGPRHNLPRDESSPHAGGTARTPASWVASSREMTVVRIPLKSAKHHFGAHCSRGTRLYNEDTYQAGTIDLPSFAKKAPISLMDRRKKESELKENTPADGAGGDPQVFYFGVFDGHGGDTCSKWLRENLHRYVEHTAATFQMESTLQGRSGRRKHKEADGQDEAPKESTTQDVKPEEAEQELITSWRDTVGGYFRRFQPDFFPTAAGGRGHVLAPSTLRNDRLETRSSTTPPSPDPDALAPSNLASSAEAVLSYSFLRADLDFITDRKSISVATATVSQQGSSAAPSEEEVNDETEAEDEELGLGRHEHHSAQPFLGGSTCSLALISTPTPTPFWHPSTPFTVLTSHLGDTRILLCSTSSGAAVPLTPTHHPSSPSEAARLRRYAAAFTTDSFGEERMSGLANTRAFGDRRSKRIGVSAEPALTLLHAAPAQFSFIVLVSDGVTGVLADQEIVDIVKEAKTPEQGAQDVVGYATEVGAGEQGDSDNATCVCVRLGGWERRSEGGVGSLGTREAREWRRREAGSGAGRRT